MSANQVAVANERLKELEAMGHGIPGARIAEMTGRPELRWRLYARLQWSVDGTTNEATAVNTEALLATAYTMSEILEKAHEYAHDAHRQAAFFEFGRNRAMRGLPLDTEPLPETPEQQARTAELRQRVKRGQEEYREGMRRHLHGQLKAQGLLDVARKYHRKTGRLRSLFAGMGQWFDLGRKA